MLEIYMLGINFILEALYCMLILPFFSITFKDTAETPDLIAYHKNKLKQLSFCVGVLAVMWVVTIYTQSVWMLFAIALTVLSLITITIIAIVHYCKHRLSREERRQRAQIRKALKRKTPTTQTKQESVN